MNKAIHIIIRIACDAVGVILDVIRIPSILVVILLTWISRKFWKRYLGVETPLYKRWKAQHTRYIQRKLDKAHAEWKDPYVSII